DRHAGCRRPGNPGAHGPASRGEGRDERPDGGRLEGCGPVRAAAVARDARSVLEVEPAGPVRASGNRPAAGHGAGDAARWHGPAASMMSPDTTATEAWGLLSSKFPRLGRFLSQAKVKILLIHH